MFWPGPGRACCCCDPCKGGSEGQGSFEARNRSSSFRWCTADFDPLSVLGAQPQPAATLAVDASKEHGRDHAQSPPLDQRSSEVKDVLTRTWPSMLLLRSLQGRLRRSRIFLTKKKIPWPSEPPLQGLQQHHALPGPDANLPTSACLQQISDRYRQQCINKLVLQLRVGSLLADAACSAGGWRPAFLQACRTAVASPARPWSISLARAAAGPLNWQEPRCSRSALSVAPALDSNTVTRTKSAHLSPRCYAQPQGHWNELLHHDHLSPLCQVVLPWLGPQGRVTQSSDKRWTVFKFRWCIV